MEYYINPRAIILNVSGKDSRRYLNARLSNDVKILTPGSGCYAAALSPQGRAEGYFQIACLSENEFLAICDGGHRETVIPAFRRYLVADRVNVSEISESSALFSIINPDRPAISKAFNLNKLPQLPGDNLTADNVHFISTRRAKEQSLDIVIPKERSAHLKSVLNENKARELSTEEFLLYSIKAGIPTFPKELNEDVIFSASGLDYAVSFKKGCYVGQEVIEKIDAYGKVPYVLKAICAKGNLSENPSIKLGISEISKDKILSRYYDQFNDTTYYFVEIKNNNNLIDSEVSIDNNRANFL